MVGIIITGHGRFGAGIASAIELIAGPQDSYEVVNFEHEVDELTNDLNAAFKKLANCDGIIVFADLAGGSPFKTAVLEAQKYEHIEVIAGTNLPMLAEIVMARTMGLDLDTLVSMALNTGKEQILKFDSSDLETNEEPDDFSDGI